MFYKKEDLEKLKLESKRCKNIEKEYFNYYNNDINNYNYQ